MISFPEHVVATDRSEDRLALEQVSRSAWNMSKPIAKHQYSFCDETFMNRTFKARHKKSEHKDYDFVSSVCEKDCKKAAEGWAGYWHGIGTIVKCAFLVK